MPCFSPVLKIDQYSWFSSTSLQSHTCIRCRQHSCNIQPIAERMVHTWVIQRACCHLSVYVDQNQSISSKTLQWDRRGKQGRHILCAIAPGLRFAVQRHQLILDTTHSCRRVHSTPIRPSHRYGRQQKVDLVERQVVWRLRYQPGQSSRPMTMRCQTFVSLPPSNVRLYQDPCLRPNANENECEHHCNHRDNPCAEMYLQNSWPIAIAMVSSRSDSKGRYW